MKHILLLLALLFTLLGCGERYDHDITILDCPEGYGGDYPRIVKVDSPTEEIGPGLLFDEDLHRHVIVLNGDGFQTVTVTFSSPPQNLSVNIGPTRALDYTLRGTLLTMTVYYTIGQQGNDGRLYIRWDGGGAFLAYWCPYED